VAAKGPSPEDVTMPENAVKFGEVLLKSERFRDFVRRLGEAAAEADVSRQQE
jgi:hypothetical protein